MSQCDILYMPLFSVYADSIGSPISNFGVSANAIGCILVEQCYWLLSSGAHTARFPSNLLDEGLLWGVVSVAFTSETVTLCCLE